MAPKNIHIPVMFFLHSIIKERIRAIKSKLNGMSFDKHKYRQEVKYNQGRTWWDKLWNGDNTDSLNDKISSLSDEEKNMSLQLEDLEQVFGSMKDMFKVCKIFYEGRLMSF